MDRRICIAFLLLLAAGVVAYSQVGGIPTTRQDLDGADFKLEKKGNTPAPGQPPPP